MTSFIRSRRATSAPPRRLRSGRMLVECLVAAMLLAVTALVVSAATQGLALSTQSAQLTTAAWAVASSSAESTVGGACAPHIATGTDVLTRVTSHWSEQQLATWRERDVSATLQLSPFATARHHTAVTLTWQQGVPCP